MSTPLNIDLIQRVILNAQGWWCDFSGELDDLSDIQIAENLSQADILKILLLFCDINQWSAINPKELSGIQWSASIESYESFKSKTPHAVPFIKV
ncbi:MAG: hypothetical protein QM533_05275 [Cytophagales bacterium]|nr:hypothetical protein [Cytophagales bacterium]